MAAGVDARACLRSAFSRLAGATARIVAANKGRGLIFVPYCRAEVEPDWSGNLEMVDCETDEQRVQHIGPDLLERYRDSYARHFALWQGAGPPACGCCSRVWRPSRNSTRR
jgi:hypothetical protein